MNRAYSILDCREFDDSDSKFVTVKGIASTPTPDRMNDIVEPMGAKFKTPMPFLLYHDHQLPVGNITMAQPTDDGIPFEAVIPKVTEPGRVKDRVDEAIHSLKYNLLNAVSIGFAPIEFSHLDDGGLRFAEWEWLELSLVSVPAQSEAVITAVKSFDQKHLPASGVKGAEVEKPASGRKREVPKGPFYY